MPVECPAVTVSLCQESFHQLDRRLMGEMFAMHNSMGRFFDEKIYQAEFVWRCLELGIDARQEVEVRVSHKDFSKSYFLDLLVAQGCLYEFKTAASFNPAHQKQLINYLLLTGLNHGKLVNFRSNSVDSRFVSTRIREEDRKRFNINTLEWRGQGSALEDSLLALLQDWGTFLDIDLYRDALLHLIRTPGSGIETVPVIVNGRIRGHQKLCMLDSDSAWHLSAIREHQRSYELHIRRLLAHTPLARIHWINFNQHQIDLKTLFK